MEEMKQDLQFQGGQEELKQEVTNYYCSNCQLYLKSNAEYKIHYKSEFHRYNIKRKLVDLPPVTDAQYQSLMLEQKNQQVQGQKQSQDLYCQLCHKNFQTSSTFKQHQNSTKHKQLQKEQEAELKKYENQQQQQQPGESNIESVKKVPQKQPQEHIKTSLEDTNICLFCNQPNKDIQENVNHMRTAHSFFIIEAQFVKNLEGLIKYLAEKINIGLLCIYCENKKTKDFKSPQAVRKHMVDRGHCFMNTDRFDEYEDFYDFSSQLHEFEIIDSQQKKEHEEQKKQGYDEDYIELVSDNDDEDDEYEEVSDEEWEDDKGKQGEEGEKKQKISEDPEQQQQNTDLETAKQLGKEQFRNKQNKLKKKRKQYIRVKKVKLLDTGELYIPESKKIVGHRDYRIYYKQYLRHLNTPQQYAQSMIGQNVYDDRIQKFDNQQRQIMLLEKINILKEKKQQRTFEEDFKKRQKHEVKVKLNGNFLQRHFRKQCNA